MTEATTLPSASQQRWIVACAAFATFMGTLDEFIVGISLPSITRTFNTSTSLSVWIVISYFLMVTSTLILFGKLVDRKGLKRVFLAGYLIFIAGSLLCGISGSIGMLIAARFLQGLGGSMLRVAAYAIVPRHLPPEKRGWGYGILSTASASGIMLGAPAGGFIIGLLSWHWIFLVNLPIGLVALLLVQRMLPADPPQPTSAGPFDLPGAGLSFLGFFALAFALNMGHDLGWGNPFILGSLMATGILFSAFVIRERRVSDPLVDLGLLSHPSFLLGNLGLFMACMFMAGDGFLFPFVLQTGLGFSASKAGLMFLVYSLVYVPTAQLAGRLSDSIPPNRLCTLAMLSGTAACAFFIATVGRAGPWAAFVFMAWAAASCAMFISPCNNHLMSHAPTGQQGSASGILGTANQLSGVIGVVIFEAIFSAPGEALGEGTLNQVQASALHTGFRGAYACGLLMCLAAAVFIFLSGRWRPEPVQKG